MKYVTRYGKMSHTYPVLDSVVLVPHYWEVQHFLYSSGLTPKLVQHRPAATKKRVHNGAVKSRGEFNYKKR